MSLVQDSIAKEQSRKTSIPAASRIAKAEHHYPNITPRWRGMHERPRVRWLRTSPEVSQADILKKKFCMNRLQETVNEGTILIRGQLGAKAPIAAKTVSRARIKLSSTLRLSNLLTLDISLMKTLQVVLHSICDMKNSIKIMSSENQII